MVQMKLTIKNYRCFTDTHPLTIEFGNDFTAFVGPNNSGKSSCLRMLFELRQLWGALQNPRELVNVMHGGYGFSYQGVHDQEEIFCDSNSRALSIEIEPTGTLKDEAENSIPCLKKMIGMCDRGKPNTWTFRFFFLNSNQEIEIDKEGGISVDGDGTRINVSLHGAIDCKLFVESMLALQNILYIGPFRNAINEGAGSYFDLAIGSSFISTRNTWKTSGTKFQMRAIEAVTTDIQSIFGFNQFEINASEHLKTLSTYVDGKPYRLSELGAGLAQFIIVFGNAAIRRPSFILIDEPELNLHPSLQVDFLTSLASYARNGIIYATHSVGLARATANRIYSFQKQSGVSLVKPFEQTANYAEFLGELSFSLFKDMGCDSILLVEGGNDVKVVQQFLRMLGKDHGIVILPLGGDQLAKGGVEAELSELKRLSGNIAALVDSEREHETDRPLRAREKFQEACQRLQFPVCLTQRRALENYFTDAAVKSVLGERYRALGAYERLRDCPSAWSKALNWKIARNMSFDELRGTDIGEFLESL